jgi:hypothetical protein
MHKIFTQDCLQFSTQIIIFYNIVCESDLMSLTKGCNMSSMKQWMVVVSSGAMCVSLAWAAAPVAAPEAVQSRVAAGAPEAPTAAPDARSSRSVLLSNEASQRVAGARPSQAQAGAPRSVEEARASLGQMLASWGLVACIALRRIFD